MTTVACRHFRVGLVSAIHHGRRCALVVPTSLAYAQDNGPDPGVRAP